MDEQTSNSNNNNNNNKAKSIPVQWSFALILNFRAFFFRVETPTKETFDSLTTIENLHFWNQGRVGSHADAMVAPDRLSPVQIALFARNF
jgi:hypothetical protein